MGSFSWSRTMLQSGVVLSLAMGLSACVSIDVDTAGIEKAAEAAAQSVRAPTSPAEALNAYYRNFTSADLPVAPAGKSMPGKETVLTRIAFASCQTAEKPIPILDQVAADQPELMVYMGDNIYGDAYAGDMALPELRKQYAKLASLPEFARLRAAVPMIATWDDHDFGLNDAGGDFSAKYFAKTIFERFWGTGQRLAGREGIYDSYTFGPAGQRVQIILLDTRFNRSSLTRMAERGSMGPYLPSKAPDQAMLGEAQWAWLEAELKKPADLRFLVTSIQLLADGHDFEAWETLPAEQTRMYDLFARVKPQRMVVISGDRHSAGLYRQDGLGPYPLVEMTTSSLNLSFASSSKEKSSQQIGDMFTPVNYGIAQIDWSAKTLALDIRGADGKAVRSLTVPFAQIEGR